MHPNWISLPSIEGQKLLFAWNEGLGQFSKGHGKKTVNDISDFVFQTGLSLQGQK